VLRICAALVVAGERARQSVRQSDRTSVDRFMGESNRSNGFQFLSLREMQPGGF